VSAAAELKQEKSLVERVAAAVLYEGYVLYPYRPSSVKNQQRWNFCVDCPESYSVAQKGTEAALMQTQCLLLANETTRLSVSVKFLQLISREVAASVAAPDSTKQVTNFQPVNSLEYDGRLYNTWQEAVEREVGPISITFADSKQKTESLEFAFPPQTLVEELRSADGSEVVGQIKRRQSELLGSVNIEASACSNSSSALKLTIQVRNTTPFAGAVETSRDEALLNSFVSTHTVLYVENGEFVSLLDPPVEFREVATECKNIGTYPVLIGVGREKDCMLSSPIILYDYPQIAPESPGDLFDGTEIDEILTLRILTLTDEEKREIRASDDRARQLLERTEMLPLEQFMKLHGAMKGINRKEP
jgi:hydrogenase maturation protease